ncbi:serine O-acetyltransferase EpsC [Sphingomicrobium flavum]|uniref:serine O-acetyltransferase EpsC n=1 Tax=Sphingomicrobium flavum TaxID=1229164 RepID=UPI0021AD976E|nr:serine O-acetyltransferase EpsC [Sphingomicrobium flavum]
MALLSLLDSIKARDPAPRSRWEILFYPGVIALGLHRFAHWLWGGKLYFLARMVNHFARAITAIDIHPGAKIGEHLFIDHGFTVIGETAEIGKNVTIYQCVTLGGTSPFDGIGGKRHPTLEDNVVLGSGAQVLGPITIGKGARVGAGAVVTKDVAPGATMVGPVARPIPVDAESTKGFMPYGTPCDELTDPVDIKLCQLEQELKRLKAELEAARNAAAEARGSRRA